MNWYRVTVGATGVKSVVRVQQAHEENSGVFYFQAKNEKEASKIGLNLYRKYSRDMVRSRRARYRAEGKCQCGRTLTGDFKKCLVCRERGKEFRERNPGKHARVGDRNEEQRLETFAKTSRDRKAEVRLETLLDVREAFMRNLTLRQFGEWLNVEIMQLVDKSQLKTDPAKCRHGERDRTFDAVQEIEHDRRVS